MTGDNLLTVQSSLRREGILISFTGRFSQGIIEELGEAVKKYLEYEEHPPSNVFNIFSIFIEQTQNVKNYCRTKQDQSCYERISNSCIVAIGKTEAGNFICSGNLIVSHDAEQITRNLDQVRQADRAALKKLYKEKLRSEIDPNGLGAGLGFIDMARKSTFPLEYSMTPIDDQFSFFTLKAIV